MFLVFSARAQTPILYRALDCTGSSNNLPVTFQNLLHLQVGQQQMIVGLPVTITPTNGQFTSSLNQGLYNMTVRGISSGALVLIPDSTDTQSVHLCIVSNIATFTRSNLAVVITNRMFVDAGTNATVSTNGFHFTVSATAGNFNTTQIDTNNGLTRIKPGALFTNAFFYDNALNQFWFSNNNFLASLNNSAQIGNILSPWNQGWFNFISLSGGSPQSGQFLKFTDTAGDTVPANLAASDIASGTMATARLGSGSATANTLLHGNQTYGAVVLADTTGITAEMTNVVHTNYTDTIWNKNIALVFCGDSLTSTDHVNWPIYLTNAPNGMWGNAPVTFSTNTAVGGDTAGNISTNFTTRIGQYITATVSSTTNVYSLCWAGINDIGISGGHLGATNAIASLSNIWAQSRFLGAKVVAFTITDSSAFTTQDRYERQNLNSLIRSSGKNGTNGWDYLVDVDANFASGPGLPSYLERTLDGVHFNTNTQAQISKLVDWSLRNGTRGTQPFPLSQIDLAHGAGAPLLYWPNTYHRQQIITPAWNADLYQNTAGNGIILMDPSNYVSMAFDAPNINVVLWDNFPSGKFSFFFGPGTSQNVDNTQYASFTYSSKAWRFDNALSLGADAVSSAILQSDSTTKGWLPPRMTKTQRNAISSPATGLVVWQTDNTPGLRSYNGTHWVRFTETNDD
jgi:hypothetical protein